MLKTLGITLGLCGMMVLAGAGLSEAQNKFGQPTALAPGAEPDSFALDDGIALGRITAPAAAASAPAPLPDVMVVTMPPVDVRPVARPKDEPAPDLGAVTYAAAATKPVFGNQVSRDAMSYKTHETGVTYADSRPPRGSKLKGRVLIGVYR